MCTWHWRPPAGRVQGCTKHRLYIINLIRLLHILMVHNLNTLGMFVPNFTISLITINVANQDDGK